MTPSTFVCLLLCFAPPRPSDVVEPPESPRAQRAPGDAPVDVPYIPETWVVSCSVVKDSQTYRKYSARVNSDGAAVARFSYGSAPVREGALNDAARRKVLEHATY